MTEIEGAFASCETTHARGTTHYHPLRWSLDIWWRCRCHDVLLNECPNRDKIRAALAASATEEGPSPTWMAGDQYEQETTDD